jgi:hypothetical protein
MSPLDPNLTAAALDTIRRAFPERSFPRDTAIAQGGRWFDEAGEQHAYASAESSEVTRFFAGEPWTRFPGEALLQWSHASVSLRLLTPRARAYYLPAYLTAFLTTPLNPVSFAVLESAVDVLTAPGGDVAHQRLQRHRPDTRSAPQKQAMNRQQGKSFQDFVDALDDAQKAAVTIFLHAVEPLFEEPELGLTNPVTTALDSFWGHSTPR